MRILICGAGAMGCLFGALLTHAGEEVWLLSHWTEHMARIQAEGLRLHAEDGRIHHVALATVGYDDPLPKGVEVAFISVKSHATAEAAARAAQALAPSGVAVTMQNGVGNQAVLAAAVGAERALLGVTAHGATLLGPGEVRHAGSGPTHLAAVPDPVWAARLAMLLTRAGVASAVEPDIEAVVWNKLLVNVGINALTAILDVPNGVLVENPHSMALLRAAVEEGAAVARAKGIAIAPDPAARTLSVARATSTNISSMLADRRRHAPTEIEVINGAIVREGAALGIPTPVNATLVGLVRSLDREDIDFESGELRKILPG